MSFPPLPQPKLVLNLVTPEGCKAELTVRRIGKCYAIIKYVSSPRFSERGCRVLHRIYCTVCYFRDRSFMTVDCTGTRMSFSLNLCAKRLNETAKRLVDV